MTRYLPPYIDVNTEPSALSVAIHNELTKDVRSLRDDLAGALARITALEAGGGGSLPSFSVLPSIVGTPQVGVPMVFDDGIPPLGFLINRRALIDATTGVEIAASTGALSYTPVAGDLSKAVKYRVTIPLIVGTLSVDSAVKSIAGASVIPVTISGAPPVTGQVGQVYSFTPTTANGAGAKTFTLSAGTLLGGLSFSTSTGAITGTPTVAGTMSGLVVTVTDTSGSASTVATAVTIAAGDGRRTNPAVSYGYGDLTRNGFGAVSLNSDYLGITRPGMEKPVSYSTAVLTSGTAAHWNTATSTTNTPTKKAALTDATYVFQLTATFADTTTENITLTINRLTDVYTVGTADALVTVGITDAAIINGKTVEFAAGCNYRVAGVAGRKFFASWRPSTRVTVRPHDVTRMAFPPSWYYQSCQNVTFDNLWIAGDLSHQGLASAHVWTRAASDTNNNIGLIHTNQRIVYDQAWYSSADAGTLGYFLRTGSALAVGTDVIPVEVGAAPTYSGSTVTNDSAIMKNRGVNPGDRIMFPGSTTVYTVLEDNITYGATNVASGSTPYVMGGSFKISPALDVAVNASANVTALPTPNAYSAEWCDDVLVVNPMVGNVRGIMSGGLNPNAKFVIQGMKCRHYFDNVIITGTTAPQNFEFYDCVWMSPDRVSKYLHVDAIQVAFVSQNARIKMRRCMSIQADGGALIQGLFQRGDHASQLADGSLTSTFDVDNYVITTAAVSAINMGGSKDSTIRHMTAVPAIGKSTRNDLDPFYANAMSANFNKVATDNSERFAGTNLLDKSAFYSDLVNQISSSKLTITNTVAHGARLYSSAEAPFGNSNYAKTKTIGNYLSGNYYNSDPVALVSAIPYTALAFDAAVSATKTALAPKLNGGYKLADGSYMTALNPDGSWATDAAYVPA